MNRKLISTALRITPEPIRAKIRAVKENYVVAPAIIGMTTQLERDYYEHYTCDLFSGKGQIVDLGCWMGSTTISLAKGFVASGNHEVHRHVTIHAYDNFVWDSSYMDPLSPLCLGLYKTGESFLPEFRRRLNRYSEHVTIRQGDLSEVTWNGEKIELLLVDAMKSWELAGAITTNFFPQLIPNVSYLIHQDYKHYYTSWIHLLMYRLRNNFALVKDIPESGSVVFICTDVPDVVACRNAVDFDSFTDDEIDRAFQYSLKLVHKQDVHRVAAAEVMYYVHRGETNKAGRVMQECLDGGMKLKDDLAQVMELIEELSRSD